MAVHRFHVVKGGGRGKRCTMGLKISPHVSRTRSASLEKVRAKIWQLDEKFNNIQSSFLAVMAKLGIPREREVGTPLSR